MNVNKELIRRQALLIGAGVALQFAGSLCLCAASVLALKEINTQIKKHLQQYIAE